MGCTPYWLQINTVSSSLRKLRLAGFGIDNPAMRALEAERGKLLRQIAIKFPRIPIPLGALITLSPQRIRVWHDPESGWQLEQRESPTSPPTWRRISDEEAIALLKDSPDPELVHRLIEPVAPVDN